jgi:hypothetical protein
MPLNPPFAQTNTAPTGQENTGVTRGIQRKAQILETTTLLPANGVFTGPWHDTQADGTVYVTATSVSNVVSAATVGLLIQGSEDQITTINLGSAGALTVTRASANIRQRYWRVVYTNSVTVQSSFSLYVSTSNTPLLGTLGTNLTGAPDAISIVTSGANTGLGDNQSITNLSSLQSPAQNVNSILAVTSFVYGGTFSGTANLSLSGYSRPRVPTIYKSITATASGSTAVWTPATNNKFRLLKFKIEVTANAAQAAPGVITIEFLDSTTLINLTHSVYVPGTGASTLAGPYNSGWIDLGNFGVLSAAANNVLNINLSTALTAGVVNVIACGTED